MYDIWEVIGGYSMFGLACIAAIKSGSLLLGVVVFGILFLLRELKKS